MLLDDLPPARGLGSWFARQPRELRMRVRQARARLPPFIDQGVQVAGWFCAASLLPRLCDQSDLIVGELRDRSEVAGRVHDDLLAVECRIEVGDDPDAPLNLWLHDVAWWHLELLPRLSVLAGLELGAGVYINTLAPEEAAVRLRDAKSR